MTNVDLAKSYLVKAKLRLSVLDLLAAERAWSDVVREAQELVELALKAMLRQVLIDPPKWHDVGPLLLQEAHRFPDPVRGQLERLAADSAWLREHRERAFYGADDAIPTEEYGPADGARALEAARLAAEVATLLIDHAHP